jgi:uncharacterized protein (DUF2236 family)
MRWDGPITANAEVDVEAELYDAFWGVTVLLLAIANVVMELSLLPVGRGVAESTVESGRVDRHPIKRARTTVAYLAIALFGSEDERAAYRREVNRVHRLVRSRPDSDVSYSALDPELQLWVAACLYVGLDQAMRMTAPRLAGEHADALYRHAARLATTLQVPQDSWPRDRASFAGYWRAGLERIEVDAVTRAYLRGLCALRFLPRPIAWALGPAHRFMVSGFLAAPFRDALGLPWSARRELVHGRLVAAVLALVRLFPPPLRRFPVNAYLWDTRRRIRRGRAIV